MARTKKTETAKKTTVAEATKSLAAKTEKLVDSVTKKVSTGKTAAKKSEDVSEKANVVLQFAGKDVTYDELVQNAKNKFQYDMGGNVDEIKEISLYVKPDENKVYFVIDGTEGDYDL